MYRCVSVRFYHVGNLAKKLTYPLPTQGLAKRRTANPWVLIYS